MKTISNIVTHVTKKLLVAALAVATVCPFTLDAMKRKREKEREDETRPLKKRKIEKKCTIVCNDREKIERSFQVFSQSKVLESLFNTKVGVSTISTNTVELDDETTVFVEAKLDIDSSIMKIMAKYMDYITAAKIHGCTNTEIITGLVEVITKGVLKYHTLDTLITYAEFSNYLGIGLFSQALYILIAREYSSKKDVESPNLNIS